MVLKGRPLDCGCRYEENSRQFHFWGRNEEVQLVAADAAAAGRLKERASIVIVP